MASVSPSIRRLRFLQSKRIMKELIIAKIIAGACVDIFPPAILPKVQKFMARRWKSSLAKIIIPSKAPAIAFKAIPANNMTVTEI